MQSNSIPEKLMPDSRAIWAGGGRESERWSDSPNTMFSAAQPPPGAASGSRPAAIAVDRLALKLVNARFRGAGLDLDEPQMDGVADLTIDTKSMTATFEKFTVDSAPLSVSNGRLSIQAPDTGPVVVEGSGPVVVGLGRLGKTLKLFADPRGPNSIHGRGAGPIRFRYSGDVTTFARLARRCEFLGGVTNRAGLVRTGAATGNGWLLCRIDRHAGSDRRQDRAARVRSRRRDQRWGKWAAPRTWTSTGQ